MSFRQQLLRYPLRNHNIHNMNKLVCLGANILCTKKTATFHVQKLVSGNFRVFITTMSQWQCLRCLLCRREKVGHSELIYSKSFFDHYYQSLNTPVSVKILFWAYLNFAKIAASIFKYSRLSYKIDDTLLLFQKVSFNFVLFS